jgi:hypothetical protein
MWMQPFWQLPKYLAKSIHHFLSASTNTPPYAGAFMPLMQWFETLHLFL